MEMGWGRTNEKLKDQEGGFMKVRVSEGGAVEAIMDMFLTQPGYFCLYSALIWSPNHGEHK